MTVELTNCQLQGVYDIRTYDVTMYAGVFAWGGGEEGGGGSICNKNTVTTPSTNAKGFYIICETRYKTITFSNGALKLIFLFYRSDLCNLYLTPLPPVA